MKYVLLLLVSCITCLGTPIPEGAVKYNARITYYSDSSKRVADPQTKHAKTGITVAAHPKFKFSSKVYIPFLTKVYDGDGIFHVQDRGPAVTSKKASRGKAFVFDVYVSSRAELKKFANSFPRYMEVYILP